MSGLQTWPGLVNSNSGNKSHHSNTKQLDSDDDVFLMGPPPPAESGGGGESHPSTETNLYQKQFAVQGTGKSSWNEPGAGTLYTGGSSMRDPSTRAELVRSAATFVVDGELFKNHDEFPLELATSTNLDSAMSQACASVGASYYRHNQPRGSIFDDLLFEIYQRWYESHRDSLDSDTFTEYSSATEFAHYKSDSCHEGVDRRIKKFSRSFLEDQGKKMKSCNKQLVILNQQLSFSFAEKINVIFTLFVLCR